VTTDSSVATQPATDNVAQPRPLLSLASPAMALWGKCPLDFQQFIFMAALCNRASHYIFALWFLFSLFYRSIFFPRLISAVADWMSAILPHMVWP